MINRESMQRVLYGWSVGEFGEPRPIGIGVAAVAAVYVLLVYSNAVEVVSRAGTAGLYAGRFIIYSAFAIGILATAVQVIVPRQRSTLSWLLLGYSGLIAALIAIHATLMGEGVGLATKSFIAGIFQIIGFGFLLGLRPARTTVNGCVTVVLLVTSAFCLIDVMVSGVFSEIPGRGAGLYFNPNIAALALVLGAMAIATSWRPSWRLPIFAVVAVGLLATLSRSGMLTAVVIVLACAVPIYLDLSRNSAAYRRGAGLATLILALGISYLTYAYVSGTTFGGNLTAAQSSVFGSLMKDAAKAVGPPPAEIGSPSGSQDVQRATTANARPIDCASWTVVLRGLREAQTCPWLDPVFMDRQEFYSSGAARLLLGLRGIAAIVDAPWFGSGLDRAFSLRPHNTYLLFGIAYGVVGLLFVPLFCVFISLRMGGWRNALPVILFVVLTSAVSHDLFLVRDLVAGLAIVLSSGERAWTA